MRHTQRFCSASMIMLPMLLAGVWLSAAPAQAADNGPELVLQTGHSSTINSVVMSSDSKYVVTGSSDNTVILWDAESAQLLRIFRGHTDRVNGVALSADSKRVFSGANDSAILWDVPSGQQLQVFKGHTNHITSVALSADGKRALTGSRDKLTILWDASTGEKLQTFKGHSDGIRSVALSADGKRALTGCDDGTAILWDVSTGKALQEFKLNATFVMSVALSTDATKVVTGTFSGSAAIWDASTGKKLQSFVAGGSIYSVALSADGKRVLTGDSGMTAILWNAANGQGLATFKHREIVTCVALDSDGKRVLAGSSKTAILWDSSSGEQLKTFHGHIDPINGVTSSTDGKRVFMIGWHASVLWDAATGPLTQSSTALSNEPLLGAAGILSSDGRRVLTGSSGKTATFWDASTGAKLQAFTGHSGSVSSVALSVDGKRVVTGSSDKKAILWDASTGEKLKTFARHTGCVNAVALSSDGKRLLTGSEDESAMLWDLSTGQYLQSFKSDGLCSVSLDAEGQLALTGCDKYAVLWDVSSGKELQRFNQTGYIRCVALAANATRVVTGSDDSVAILWDATTGKQLQTFRGHSGGINSVVFVTDGKRVVTGSYDGTTRLWDANTGRELCALISLDAGQDWLVVTPSGLFDGSTGGRQKVMYRVGSGLNVLPVDRFFQDFYRPGLLASIVKGETLKPDTTFASSKPPTIKIVAPKEGGIAEKREVSIETEVLDQGGGVQGPSLFLNGARLSADATTTKDGKTLKRSFKVSLVEGDNRFEVKAACADGSWESEPALITLRYEKPLDKPVVHVVAIGISKYAEGSYKLKYARDDARAIADVFAKRGQDLYREVKVTTLLDEQATGDKIRDTLKSVPQKAQPQDTLVLFVAGHGVMVGQRYYFIPHDFKPNKDKKLEDDIRQQGLPADELTDFIGAGPALKRVVILDTCASGGVVSLFKVTSRNPFAFRGEIEKLSRAQGVCFLAASSATEEAKEPEALGHGVLTYALLAGLKAVDGGPLEGKPLQPTGKNQVAEVVEWFSYANGHVARLTKEYCGQEQNVQMSVQGQSFPVLPLK